MLNTINYRVVTSLAIHGIGIFQVLNTINYRVVTSKVWNVPTLNDVYAWFLYRQNDCIKNSKGQLAQTYYSHKELFKLTADQQIEKLNVEKSINWHEFDDNKKYGRLITKQTITTENGVVCERFKWVINDAFVLNENREKFISYIPNNI